MEERRTGSIQEALVDVAKALADKADTEQPDTRGQQFLHAQEKIWDRMMTLIQRHPTIQKMEMQPEPMMTQKPTVKKRMRICPTK